MGLFPADPHGCSFERESGWDTLRGGRSRQGDALRKYGDDEGLAKKIRAGCMVATVVGRAAVGFSWRATVAGRNCGGR